MRYLQKVVILVGLILAVSAYAGDKLSMDSFESAYQAAVTVDEAVALCEDYMLNLDDMELLRSVQNYWVRLDQIGAETFAKKQAAANPESMQWAYLYGRAQEDLVTAITIGRKIIATDPDYPYGYRLVLGNYHQGLFSPQRDEEHVARLTEMMAQDGALFAKAVEVTDGESWSLEFLYGYQVHSGQYDDAKITLEKGTAQDTDWPSQMDYAGLYACMGRFVHARVAVEEYVNEAIEGGLPEKERESYLDHYYESALRSAEAYVEIVKLEQSADGFQEDPNALYNIACAFSLMGNADSAFIYLAQATDAGFDRVRHLLDDSDVRSLHSDPRWEKYVAVTQTNWDSGKDERREKALSEKLDRPAPEFNLPGVDSNLVALTDLRGKVVVLDFWATWCQPCRMTMPVIDEFVKTKPEDVLVLSINVWEQNSVSATKFMEENGYGMTLLFGDQQTASDYGVRGIPYLCVIDQDGIIRYEHPGYSDGLGEDLVWWTEDLLNAN